MGKGGGKCASREQTAASMRTPRLPATRPTPPTKPVIKDKALESEGSLEPLISKKEETLRPDPPGDVDDDIDVDVNFDQPEGDSHGTESGRRLLAASPASDYQSKYHTAQPSPALSFSSGRCTPDSIYHSGSEDLQPPMASPAHPPGMPLSTKYLRSAVEEPVAPLPDDDDLFPAEETLVPSTSSASVPRPGGLKKRHSMASSSSAQGGFRSLSTSLSLPAPVGRLGQRSTSFSASPARKTEELISPVQLGSRKEAEVTVAAPSGALELPKVVAPQEVQASIYSADFGENWELVSPQPRSITPEWVGVPKRDTEAARAGVAESIEDTPQQKDLAEAAIGRQIGKPSDTADVGPKGLPVDRQVEGLPPSGPDSESHDEEVDTVRSLGSDRSDEIETQSVNGDGRGYVLLGPTSEEQLENAAEPAQSNVVSEVEDVKDTEEVWKAVKPELVVAETTKPKEPSSGQSITGMLAETKSVSADVAEEVATLGETEPTEDTEKELPVEHISTSSGAKAPSKEEKQEAVEGTPIEMKSTREEAAPLLGKHVVVTFREPSTDEVVPQLGIVNSPEMSPPRLGLPSTDQHVEEATEAPLSEEIVPKKQRGLGTEAVPKKLTIEKEESPMLEGIVATTGATEPFESIAQGLIAKRKQVSVAGVEPARKELPEMEEEKEIAIAPISEENMEEVGVALVTAIAVPTQVSVEGKELSKEEYPEMVEEKETDTAPIAEENMEEVSEAPMPTVAVLKSETIKDQKGPEEVEPTADEEDIEETSSQEPIEARNRELGGAPENVSVDVEEPTKEEEPKVMVEKGLEGSPAGEEETKNVEEATTETLPTMVPEPEVETAHDSEKVRMEIKADPEAAEKEVEKEISVAEPLVARSQETRPLEASDREIFTEPWESLVDAEASQSKVEEHEEVLNRKEAPGQSEHPEESTETAPLDVSASEMDNAQDNKEVPTELEPKPVIEEANVGVEHQPVSQAEPGVGPEPGAIEQQPEENSWRTWKEELETQGVENVNVDGHPETAPAAPIASQTSPSADEPVMNRARELPQPLKETEPQVAEEIPKEQTSEIVEDKCVDFTPSVAETPTFRQEGEKEIEDSQPETDAIPAEGEVKSEAEKKEVCVEAPVAVSQLTETHEELVAEPQEMPSETENSCKELEHEVVDDREVDSRLVAQDLPISEEPGEHVLEAPAPTLVSRPEEIPRSDQEETKAELLELGGEAPPDIEDNAASESLPVVKSERDTDEVPKDHVVQTVAEEVTRGSISQEFEPDEDTDRELVARPQDTSNEAEVEAKELAPEMVERKEIEVTAAIQPPRTTAEHVPVPSKGTSSDEARVADPSEKAPTILEHVEEPIKASTFDEVVPEVDEEVVRVAHPSEGITTSVEAELEAPRPDKAEQTMNSAEYTANVPKKPKIEPTTQEVPEAEPVEAMNNDFVIDPRDRSPDVKEEPKDLESKAVEGQDIAEAGAEVQTPLEQVKESAELHPSHKVPEVEEKQTEVIPAADQTLAPNENVETSDPPLSDTIVPDVETAKDIDAVPTELDNEPLGERDGLEGEPPFGNPFVAKKQDPKLPETRGRDFAAEAETSKDMNGVPKELENQPVTEDKDDTESPDVEPIVAAPLEETPAEIIDHHYITELKETPQIWEGSSEDHEAEVENEEGLNVLPALENTPASELHLEEPIDKRLADVKSPERVSAPDALEVPKDLDSEPLTKEKEFQEGAPIVEPTPAASEDVEHMESTVRDDVPEVTEKEVTSKEVAPTVVEEKAINEPSAENAASLDEHAEEEPSAAEARPAVIDDKDVGTEPTETTQDEEIPEELEATLAEVATHSTPIFDDGSHFAEPTKDLTLKPEIADRKTVAESALDEAPLTTTTEPGLDEEAPGDEPTKDPERDVVGEREHQAPLTVEEHDVVEVMPIQEAPSEATLEPPSEGVKEDIVHASLPNPEVKEPESEQANVVQEASDDANPEPVSLERERERVNDTVLKVGPEVVEDKALHPDKVEDALITGSGKEVAHEPETEVVEQNDIKDPLAKQQLSEKEETPSEEAASAAEHVQEAFESPSSNEALHEVEDVTDKMPKELETKPEEKEEETEPSFFQPTVGMLPGTAEKAPTLTEPVQSPLEPPSTDVSREGQSVKSTEEDNPKEDNAKENPLSPLSKVMANASQSEPEVEEQELTQADVTKEAFTGQVPLNPDNGFSEEKKIEAPFAETKVEETKNARSDVLQVAPVEDSFEKAALQPEREMVAESDVPKQHQVAESAKEAACGPEGEAVTEKDSLTPTAESEEVVEDKDPTLPAAAFEMVEKEPLQADEVDQAPVQRGILPIPDVTEETPTTETTREVGVEPESEADRQQDFEVPLAEPEAEEKDDAADVVDPLDDSTKTIPFEPKGEQVQEKEGGLPPANPGMAEQELAQSDVDETATVSDSRKEVPSKPEGDLVEENELEASLPQAEEVEKQADVVKEAPADRSTKEVGLEPKEELVEKELEPSLPQPEDVEEPAQTDGVEAAPINEATEEVASKQEEDLVEDNELEASLPKAEEVEKQVDVVEEAPAKKSTKEVGLEPEEELVEKELEPSLPHPEDVEEPAQTVGVEAATVEDSTQKVASKPEEDLVEHNELEASFPQAEEVEQQANEVEEAPADKSAKEVGLEPEEELVEKELKATLPKPEDFEEPALTIGVQAAPVNDSIEEVASKPERDLVEINELEASLPVAEEVEKQADVIEEAPADKPTKEVGLEPQQDLVQKDLEISLPQPTEVEEPAQTDEVEAAPVDNCTKEVASKQEGAAPERHMVAASDVPEQHEVDKRPKEGAWEPEGEAVAEKNLLPPTAESEEVVEDKDPTLPTTAFGMVEKESVQADEVDQAPVQRWELPTPDVTEEAPLTDTTREVGVEPESEADEQQDFQVPLAEPEMEEKDDAADVVDTFDGSTKTIPFEPEGDQVQEKERGLPLAKQGMVEQEPAQSDVVDSTKEVPSKQEEDLVDNELEASLPEAEGIEKQADVVEEAPNDTSTKETGLAPEEALVEKDLEPSLSQPEEVKEPAHLDGVEAAPDDDSIEEVASKPQEDLVEKNELEDSLPEAEEVEKQADVVEEAPNDTSTKETGLAPEEALVEKDLEPSLSQPEDVKEATHDDSTEEVASKPQEDLIEKNELEDSLPEAEEVEKQADVVEEAPNDTSTKETGLAPEEALVEKDLEPSLSQPEDVKEPTQLDGVEAAPVDDSTEEVDSKPEEDLVELEGSLPEAEEVEKQADVVEEAPNDTSTKETGLAPKKELVKKELEPSQPEPEDVQEPGQTVGVEAAPVDDSTEEVDSKPEGDLVELEGSLPEAEEVGKQADVVEEAPTDKSIREVALELEEESVENEHEPSLPEPADIEEPAETVEVEAVPVHDSTKEVASKSKGDLVEQTELEASLPKAEGVERQADVVEEAPNDTSTKEIGLEPEEELDEKDIEPSLPLPEDVEEPAQTHGVEATPVDDSNEDVASKPQEHLGENNELEDSLPEAEEVEKQADVVEEVATDKSTKEVGLEPHKKLVKKELEPSLPEPEDVEEPAQTVGVEATPVDDSTKEIASKPEGDLVGENEFEASLRQAKGVEKQAAAVEEPPTDNSTREIGLQPAGEVVEEELEPSLPEPEDVAKHPDVVEEGPIAESTKGVASEPEGPAVENQATLGEQKVEEKEPPQADESTEEAIVGPESGWPQGKELDASQVDLGAPKKGVTLDGDGEEPVAKTIKEIALEPGTQAPGEIELETSQTEPELNHTVIETPVSESSREVALEPESEVTGKNGVAVPPVEAKLEEGPERQDGPGEVHVAETTREAALEPEMQVLDKEELQAPPSEPEVKGKEATGPDDMEEALTGSSTEETVVYLQSRPIGERDEVCLPEEEVEEEDATHTDVLKEATSDEPIKELATDLEPVGEPVLPTPQETSKPLVGEFSDNKELEASPSGRAAVESKEPTSVAVPQDIPVEQPSKDMVLGSEDISGSLIATSRETSEERVGAPVVEKELEPSPTEPEALARVSEEAVIGQTKENLLPGTPKPVLATFSDENDLVGSVSQPTAAEPAKFIVQEETNEETSKEAQEETVVTRPEPVPQEGCKEQVTGLVQEVKLKAPTAALEAPNPVELEQGEDTQIKPAPVQEEVPEQEDIGKEAPIESTREIAFESKTTPPTTVSTEQDEQEPTELVSSTSTEKEMTKGTCGSVAFQAAEPTEVNEERSSAPQAATEDVKEENAGVSGDLEAVSKSETRKSEEASVDVHSEGAREVNPMKFSNRDLLTGHEAPAEEIQEEIAVAPKQLEAEKSVIKKKSQEAAVDVVLQEAGPSEEETELGAYPDATFTEFKEGTDEVPKEREAKPTFASGPTSVYEDSSLQKAEPLEAVNPESQEQVQLVRVEAPVEATEWLLVAPEAEPIAQKIEETSKATGGDKDQTAHLDNQPASDAIEGDSNHATDWELVASEIGKSPLGVEEAPKSMLHAPTQQQGGEIAPPVISLPPSASEVAEWEMVNSEREIAEKDNGQQEPALDAVGNNLTIEMKEPESAGLQQLVPPAEPIPRSEEVSKDLTKEEETSIDTPAVKESTIHAVEELPGKKQEPAEEPVETQTAMSAETPTQREGFNKNIPLETTVTPNVQESTSETADRDGQTKTVPVKSVDAMEEPEIGEMEIEDATSAVKPTLQIERVSEHLPVQKEAVSAALLLEEPSAETASRGFPVEIEQAPVEVEEPMKKLDNEEVQSGDEEADSVDTRTVPQDLPTKVETMSNINPTSKEPISKVTSRDLSFKSWHPYMNIAETKTKPKNELAKCTSTPAETKGVPKIESIQEQFVPAGEEPTVPTTSRDIVFEPEQAPGELEEADFESVIHEVKASTQTEEEPKDLPFDANIEPAIAATETENGHSVDIEGVNEAEVDKAAVLAIEPTRQIEKEARDLPIEEVALEKQAVDTAESDKLAIASKEGPVEVREAESEPHNEAGEIRTEVPDVEPTSRSPPLARSLPREETTIPDAQVEHLAVATTDRDLASETEGGHSEADDFMTDPEDALAETQVAAPILETESEIKDVSEDLPSENRSIIDSIVVEKTTIGATEKKLGVETREGPMETEDPEAARDVGTEAPELVTKTPADYKEASDELPTEEATIPVFDIDVPLPEATESNFPAEKERDSVEGEVKGQATELEGETGKHEVETPTESKEVKKDLQVEETAISESPAVNKPAIKAKQQDLALTRDGSQLKSDEPVKMPAGGEVEVVRPEVKSVNDTKEVPKDLQAVKFSIPFTQIGEEPATAGTQKPTIADTQSDTIEPKEGGKDPKSDGLDKVMESEPAEHEEAHKDDTQGVKECMEMGPRKDLGEETCERALLPPAFDKANSTGATSVPKSNRVPFTSGQATKEPESQIVHDPEEVQNLLQEVAKELDSEVVEKVEAPRLEATEVPVYTPGSDQTAPLQATERGLEPQLEQVTKEAEKEPATAVAALQKPEIIAIWEKAPEVTPFLPKEPLTSYAPQEPTEDTSRELFEETTTLREVEEAPKGIAIKTPEDTDEAAQEPQTSHAEKSGEYLRVWNLKHLQKKYEKIKYKQGLQQEKKNANKVVGLPWPPTRLTHPQDKEETCN